MHRGLKEIIPRFFVFGFGDKKPKGTIDPSLFEWIEIGVSGYIIFARNVLDPFQIWNTLKFIRENSKISPFLMTDQEGGTVVQFVNGFTTGLSPMGLTATGDPENARVVAEKIGKELRMIGINTVLAPVLDVNIEPENPIIGIRSFSDDPKIVAFMGKKLSEGFQTNGLLTTGKHFPGHGGTKTDSHVSLPLVDCDKKTFEEIHLYPFAELIKNKKLDCVMTGHVIFPKIDEKPATFSKIILTDIARKELNFDGLIITDCLEMGAIKEYGFERAVVDAFNAGADLIALSHTPSLQKKAIEILQDAIENGFIPEKRVQESLLRIEEKRQKLVRGENLNEIINYFINFNDDFDKELAERSIYLHKNSGLLPIDKKSKILLLCVIPTATGLSELNLLDPIFDIFSKHFNLLSGFSISPEITYEEFEKVRKKAEECDVAVLITRSRGSKQIESIKPLFETIDPQKIVLVAGRDPYDLFLFDYNAGIATFGLLPPHINALCRLLLGEIKSTAIFPLKRIPSFRKE